ncbi:DNA glycosylase family protein [Streptacidiphilus fuscans]|uniref:DNA-(apurinic or apyrimidinic site) lyase n=1 Tax=Streptacidiphilus fuscans TaxID=2789292 RepID=A0A931B7Y2_9ACTN|nr:endonuclease III domain-containing protein [Streptacidiphilus fuscans]MBF9071863.1 endonuclease III domain-containing protein [Streptacidiphilus fuscans]
MTPRHLPQVDTIELAIAGPFDFRHTLWKPSHFATALEAHTQAETWRTFRVDTLVCGVHMRQGSPNVLVADVFSDGEWKPEHRHHLTQRLTTSYGLDEGLEAFTELAAQVPAMRQPLADLTGMRQSCPEDLFEIAVIAMLLQNTTIARTTQMMRNLLSHYGHLVHFAGLTLRSFFTPQEIAHIPAETYKAADRLGYRDKYLPNFSKFFIANHTGQLGDNRDELMDRFQEIKGVGPYTAAVIASHASRDPAALGLDVWNRKILARKLLDKDDAEATEVHDTIGQLFPGNQGLAALYLIEHEYLRAPVVPLLKPDQLPAWNRELEGQAA